MTETSNTNLNGNWYEREVGQQVLQKKYLHENEDFNGMIERVTATAGVPAMKDYLRNADFFLAGRSLYGAGSKGKFKSSMSNCYIMPCPEDNIESIFDVTKQMARISSFGGGVGVKISKLRPKDATVNNSAKTSSGAVSFLNIFNAVGEVIGSNGRRNAMMVGLDCSHPDLYEFLKIKQANNKLESMNISILFTDEFMEAVKEDKEYALSFTIESTGEVIEKTIKAKDFFEEFCETQWNYGDPGSIFIDQVRSHNLLSGYDDYKIDICNPCAEFYGNSYNACNLGSLNLYNVVDDPFTDKSAVNGIKLKQLVKDGVIALNNILEYGYDMQPLDENRKCIDDWRSIGLGVFGLADMLIALGLRYGSEEANSMIDSIMELILITSLQTSNKLAQIDGSFGKYNWESTKKSEIIKTFQDTKLYKDIGKHGLRNGTLLSIAPAGTISTMCGISNGCEPLFMISYERTTHSLEKQGKYFKVYAKSVEDLLKHHGINPESITVDEIKKRFPFVVDSHDITPEERVRTQAVMQKYVDNAISSTVNLKESATVQDIFDTYMLAWEQGLKGITVFRDGCKRGSILGGSGANPEPKRFNSISPVKRNNIRKMDGSTFVGHTACVKNLYTTVNKMGNDVFEVFTNASTGCRSNINTITRLVSLALRSRVKVSEVIHELKANSCPACIVLKGQGKGISSSCGTAIAEAIEEAYGTTEVDETLAICPECGKRGLVPTGKCVSCTQCGYSRCD